MIIFDTETTGLPAKGNAPLEKQPHIIEFAAIKLDDEKLEEVDRMEFLCKPPIAMLDPIITKITGITMEPLNSPIENPRYLSDKKPFVSHFNDMCDFFLGERYMVAHNVSFDRQMFSFEMQRINKINQFPWPPRHICTVEQTYSVKNHRLKLAELYLWLFGEEFKDAHQAMADVEALTKVVQELHKRGMLELN